MFYICLPLSIKVSEAANSFEVQEFALIINAIIFIIKWLKCYLLKPQECWYLSYKCVSSKSNICSNILLFFGATLDY